MVKSRGLNALLWWIQDEVPVVREHINGDVRALHCKRTFELCRISHAVEYADVVCGQAALVVIKHISIC